jgi:hypothetical protein
VNVPYWLRLSAGLYDSATGETIVLKESTETQNFRFSSVSDDGEHIVLLEEYVKSPKDWADEDKVETREITVPVPALASALFAAPARAADDSEVKGLWLEIPGLPKASSTSFNVQSGGEGEAYFERVLDDGLFVVSIERVYAENRATGDAWGPGDTAKLVVRLESLRKEIEVAEDDIDVTESDEDFAEIFSYPVSTAIYATGENEDAKGNHDIFIFTDDWVFRVHMSIAGDRLEDYDTDKLDGWFENMKIVERGASSSDKSDGEEGRGDIFDEEDDKASSDKK